MYRIIGLLFLGLTLSVSGENLLPDGSFEHGTAGCWNRMIDQRYMPDDSGWKIDNTTAFHGKNSLRGDGTKPLILQTECARDGIFSVYVKSEGAPQPVKIEAFSYEVFQPIKLASAEIIITPEWQRAVLKLSRSKRLRFDVNSVPFYFKITPQKPGVLWVDAAQYELGKLQKYSEYAVPKVPAADALKMLSARFVIPPYTTSKVNINEKIPKNFQFTVSHSATAKSVPVTVVLPFADGEWRGGKDVQVRGNDGKIYPAQIDIHAVWPGSQSARAATVRFDADLQSGINHFNVEPGNHVPDQVSAKPSMMPEVFAVDIEGNQYSSLNSPEFITEVDLSGPIFTSQVQRGVLADSSGSSIAEYSLRRGIFLRGGSVNFELTLSNPNATKTLVLKSAGLKIKSMKKSLSAEYSQIFDADNLKFAVKSDIQYGMVQGTGGTLIARDAAFRHPTCLNLDQDGVFTAFLWPNKAMPLILSRDMSLHREFIYSPSSDKSVGNALGDKAMALVNTEYFTKSDFFIIPMGSVDAEKFPFVKHQLDRLEKTPKFITETILKNPGKNLHGLFNYGDIYGYSGWGNLESFVDFTAILHSVSYGNPEQFAMALKRAEHYRDVDIVDGKACYHCSNHSGGSHDFSHSWPQGLLMHYLLTGSYRSLDVARQLSRNYLSVPIDYQQISGSRSLGRYLLGLADLYAVIGNEKLKCRFFEQLAYAEKQSLNSNRRDRTVFPWHGRLDPFHLWYGACAIMQMYKMTGEKTLLNSFRREMDASLNTDFYFLDLRECWPGVSPEKGWPIQLGYHSRHRGALFYPVMRFYSDISGDSRYLELAQKAVYADYMRDCHTAQPMDILRLSVLNSGNIQADEKKLVEFGRNLVLNAASPELLNGDFSFSPDWFTFWHVPSGRQMGWDDAVEEWPLQDKKDFPALIAKWEELGEKVSPWRSYSRCAGFLDWKNFFTAPPSLRVQVSDKWYMDLGRRVSIESVKLRITPGKWKISGAYSIDPGISPNSFWRWQFVIPGEVPMTYSFDPRASADNGNTKSRLKFDNKDTKNCLKNVDLKILD